MMILFWASLFLIFYCYIGYTFLVAILADLFPRHRKSDESLRPFVSMLVSAYNEQDHIEEKIQNFLQLNYPAELKEIIIGSDCSSDKTAEILLSLKSEIIRPFIYEKRSGKAAVLNRIAKKARGEILVFSDANTMYQNDSLLKLVRHFKDESVGGVNGRLVLINPTQNQGGESEQTYWKYENILKRAEGKIKTVLGANGGIYAMRKELFIALPEDKVIVDDFLVAMNAVKQGFDVIYDSEARATETTSPHLKGEFARKIRIGAGNFNVLWEIKSLLSPAKGFVAFALWSHKMIRWCVPFLLIILLVSNIQLVSRPFYLFIFLIQLLFYSTTIIGHFLSDRYRKNKLVMYPLYFTVTNLALGIGFFKAITKTQKPAWSSVERS